MERYVLIDNYCGWPKLVSLPDGSLVMSVYNKPSHGGYRGTAECWRSEDGGRSFRFAGYPAEPVDYVSQKDDMIGVAHNGDLIDAITNYEKGTNGEIIRAPFISRSRDGGRTFERMSGDFTEPMVPGTGRLYMFGHIAQVPGTNTLARPFWTRSPDDGSDVSYAYVAFSDDDGETWTRVYRIGDSEYDYHNETAVLFFDKDHGIALCRSNSYHGFRPKPGETPVCKFYHAADALKQYRTRDGGKTWQFEAFVTSSGAHPANLIRLQDGGILLTYGCRYSPVSFICAQYSSTQGLEWESPVVLASYIGPDGGYPSSAQNPDGSICTVYYDGGSPAHTRYHVAGVIWRLDEIPVGGWFDEIDEGTPHFIPKDAQHYNSDPADIITPDWRFMI